MKSYRTLLIFLTTIAITAGCAYGESGVDGFRADLVGIQRRSEDLTWKEFKKDGEIDRCARDIVLELPLLGLCRQFKDLRETQAKALEFSAKLKNLTPEKADLVRAGQIHIGMTQAEVRLSWGPPVDVHRTVTSHSTQAQWVYGEGTNMKYLYFDEDKLTSWQD